MEVNDSDISKYGVVVPNKQPGSVAGLIEKPKLKMLHLILLALVAMS